jgi:hypothetical protein
MAFEREYALESFKWGPRGEMSAAINAVLAEHDHDRASASIACMSNDRDQLHILIEHWREDGDTEQDTTGSMDVAAKTRKPRRAPKKTNHDTGTTAGMEPEGVGDSVDAAATRELDVPLPLDEPGYGI